MTRHALLLCLALAGCGAKLHDVSLINKSPRAIEEVYVFPTGSADHGKSRGAIPAEGKLVMKIKAGNVDILAVSAKIKVDDKQSEKRTASQTLELKAPTTLVFHDSNQPVPGLDQPGTIGVVFQVTPEPEAPAQPDEAAAP